MNTRVSILWKVAVVAFLFIFATNAWCQATVGADAAFKSKYIFRGLPWNTESVFWPDVWFSSHGVTVTIFGSVNLTDTLKDAAGNTNRNKVSELDYYFDYTRAFGRINASIGWAQYSYPNTFYPNTGELYLKAASDFKILTASVIGYFDLQMAKGAYISPKLSRAFTQNAIPGLTPTLNASVGYGNKNHHQYWFGMDKAGFCDFTGSLNLAYAPPKWGAYMSVSGELGYATILDKDIADLFKNVNGKDISSNLWFGLGLNFFYSFGGVQ
ncbi:MAG: hypothetical protein NTW14_00450 [bacterium]|nr:hypothetical protein [bacterium]